MQVTKSPLKALASVGAAWRRDRAAVAPAGFRVGAPAELARFLDDMRLDDDNWLAEAEALVERCRATFPGDDGPAAETSPHHYAPGLGVIEVGLRLRRADVIDRGVALLREPEAQGSLR